jgi:hypothetical protein
VVTGIILVVGLGIWKIWDGFYVREGEAKAALMRLPYEFRFRRAPTPEGLSAVIAGRARARDGTTVNFAVLLGRAGTDTPELTIVPGAGSQSATRVGNATVITSSASATGATTNDADVELSLAIENAIFDREPLRPREG